MVLRLVRRRYCMLGHPQQNGGFFDHETGRRICMGPLKINLSQAFAGQRVGVKQVEEKIWLVSFMRYDLGFFDHETCRIESAANPFAARLSPMSPV
jgi:hypothetical protein